MANETNSGARGFSGMKGTVQWVGDSCPADLSGDLTHVASENAFPDQITKFTYTETANVKKYGHDKSYGWQDVVYGIRSAEIVVEATCTQQVTGEPDGQWEADQLWFTHPGAICYLVLYPFGECGGGIAGYAGVDRISYTVDQERGDPVSYTMTCSSKGRWQGIPGNPDNVTIAEWGGFECNCIDITSAS